MRRLSEGEIARLKTQGCAAEDWGKIQVGDKFAADYVHDSDFSGEVILGNFTKEFSLPGGVKRHSGLRNVSLHNVTVGNDCYIANVHNYIANYDISHNVFIENLDLMLVDGSCSFGNGVTVSVLNETGGREIMMFDRLSAQAAYLMTFYRYKPELIKSIEAIISTYSAAVTSDRGFVGNDVVIMNTGVIRGVKIGDSSRIEGASRLANGSVNSNSSAPVFIGNGVICDDFILCSNSQIDEGVALSRCFVGQACHLGHNYSASDSVFFSNCVGENGEACSIFAGPFTVTHHKSTLLISGMFSFMNAGSGSNQSNHMYKLGPIHQGIMERGAKTASDSYVLWPARVGPFSLVMGRHVNHADTTNFPFSYLIEQSNATYLVPGVNLRSAGTIRDARKWPKRDERTDPDKLDYVNCNLLSPYTIQKIFKGCELLTSLRKVSGELSDLYSFHSMKIRNSSLVRGLELYRVAISKFLGNSIISRLGKAKISPETNLVECLRPDSMIGDGEWVDIAGLIAPKSEIDSIADRLVSGIVSDSAALDAEFRRLQDNYYDYEWTWAYGKIKVFYGFDPQKVTADDLIKVVSGWKEDVIALDEMIYDDARKEFSLASMTGFGADGHKAEKEEDFEQVRGSFDDNPFVKEVLRHIEAKSALGDLTLSALRSHS